MILKSPTFQLVSGRSELKACEPTSQRRLRLHLHDNIYFVPSGVVLHLRTKLE
jgi:hypothetical protein